MPYRYPISREVIFQMTLFCFKMGKTGCLPSSQLSVARLVNLDNKMLKESCFFVYI